MYVWIDDLMCLLLVCYFVCYNVVDYVYIFLVFFDFCDEVNVFRVRYGVWESLCKIGIVWEFNDLGLFVVVGWEVFGIVC